MNKVESAFNSQDVLLPELEMDRGKVDIITSECLRSFLCECYAHAQDCTFSYRLTDHTLNTTAHLR